MSSLKALFGSGGGGGVPIGMYAWGNASLPDIVVDGTASYIKTGVVISSVSYPLAPSIAIGAFQRYAAAPTLPAVAGSVDTSTLLTNGSTVLAFASAYGANYRISNDGGDTFSVATLPAPAGVIDVLFASGLYFILLFDSAGKATIWRSATAVSGSWTQIYTQDLAAGTYPNSITFGAGQLLFAYVDSNQAYFIRISSNPSAAAGSVAFAAAVTAVWSGSGTYANMKIRYGKVGAGPTPAADVFFAMGWLGVYHTPTPATSASWQFLQWTGGATRPIASSRDHQVTGQGSNWIASGGNQVYVSNSSLLSPISTSIAINQSVSMGNGYAIYHSPDNSNVVTFVNLVTGSSTVTSAGAAGVGRSSAAVVLPDGTSKVWNGGGLARVSVPAGNYTGSPSQIRDDTVTITNQAPYTTQSPVAFMRIA